LILIVQSSFGLQVVSHHFDFPCFSSAYSLSGPEFCGACIIIGRRLASFLLEPPAPEAVALATRSRGAAVSSNGLATTEAPSRSKGLLRGGVIDIVVHYFTLVYGRWSRSQLPPVVQIHPLLFLDNFCFWSRHPGMRSIAPALFSASKGKSANRRMAMVGLGQTLVAWITCSPAPYDICEELPLPP
jgi:hypothetical protein